ncbi:MAG: protein kinase domain-containing protein [Planctomycetota bacterium]|jgi:serine/threonine-protein kinase
MSDDPLDAGLEAGYGKDSRAAGESVLAAIERLHGAHSQVVLREADDGSTPVSLRRDDAPAVDDSRYQILGEVARGGVGLIYRGRDKDLNRDVALKVLRPEHAESPDVIQRFIEEAQVGGQLQHPGIVPVYGMGLQPDGRAYFAMKFIKGRTLSALLDSNPDNVDLLAVFEQLALAMAYAHSRGVIHRDLKPANVMIGSFGEVIVVDWGFAKVLGFQEQKREQHTIIATVRSEAEGSQSIAGSVMGTPAYMPPEQALGHVDELDERSDVFALGAILCEILTGKPPYTGAMRDQLLAASQCRLDDAHARLDACDAPEEIKQLARDCLQPLGEDRPADASVVARRLTDHFASVEERVREAELATIDAEAAAERSLSARRRTMVLAAVALVAILVSGGGYLAWHTARERQHREAEQRVAAALEESARFERDGEFVAAISSAQKAVALAEADESDASDARSTLERLETAEEERQSRRNVHAKLALILSGLDKVFGLPQDERMLHADFECTQVVAGQLGPGQRGLDALEKLACGSELASRIAHRLDQWASYCEEPKATQLFEISLRVDASHAEWRRALRGRENRLIELFDERGIEGLPNWLAADVARHLSNQRRREEARTLLRGMVWRHPGEENLRWALGNVALHMGAVEEGKRILSAGSVIRPELKSSHHDYAAGLEYANRREEAERAWRAVTKRFPDWSHARYHHAVVLIGLGRKDEAREILSAALERDPDNPVLLCRFAFCSDDVDDRIELQRRASEIALRRAAGRAREANHLNCLAWELQKAGRDEEALAVIWRARESRPKLPNYWAWLLVQLELKQNNRTAATDAARAALETGRYVQGWWVWLLNLIPQEMDREAAVAWLRELVESSPKSAGAWYALGWFQLSAGRLAEARECAERGLALNKDHVWSIYLRASVDRQEGRLDEAERGYRRALELGKSFEFWRDLGTLLYQSKYDVAGADAAFARAVEVAPNPGVPLLHWYARTRTELGDRDKAIEVLRRAFRLWPGNAAAIARLEVALVEQGLHGEARRLYEGKEKNLSRLAYTRFLCGDAKGAIDAAKKAPTEAAARYWLGRARGNLGEHEDAVSAMESAILLDAGTGAWWTGLALELRKKRPAQDVRKALRALLDRCPDRALAIRGLGDAYFRNGDFDDWIAFARELADRESGLYQVARAQFERGRFADADATLADRQAPARLLRARLCDAMGRYEEIPALLEGLPVEGEVARLGRIAALSKRIPAMITGHDAPQDPAEALLCAWICHSLKMDREAVFFCRQSDRAGKAFPVTAAIRAKVPIAATWAREFLRARSKRYEETRSRVDTPHDAAGAIRRDWQRYAEQWKSKRSDPAWRTFWKEFDVLAERAKERTW